MNPTFIPKIWLTFLILYLAFPATAQLADDFSDGDFSADPVWIGQTDRFQVSGTLELQLFDMAPGSNNASYLVTAAPTSIEQATTWEFYFRMEFAPSASNYGEVWLAASDADLNTTATGYFLRLGGISGSDDALELYRRDPGGDELLISGSVGALGSDPAQARVRVVRDTDGTWSLAADYSGGTNFQPEGNAVDDTYSILDWFGFRCEYTSTRAEDFFFDDVLIDPVYEDDDPPQLTGITVISSTELRVSFDEALDPLTAEAEENYTILPQIGNPLQANPDAQSPEQVLLLLDEALVDGQEYELQVQQIADPAGNVLTADDITFTYQEVLPAAPYEVLIHEIMADPSPAVGLPELEFVELYNASDKTIELEGWSLGSGGSPAIFPAYLLSPGEYLLLSDEDEAGLLEPFGTTLGLSSFPALTNTGDIIILADSDGQLIHLVNYSDEWYGNSQKDDGGWTLEMINPLAPCAGRENWTASEALTGGSPGAENSVSDPNPVVGGPEIIRVYPVDELQLRVEFDRNLDSLASTDPGAYRIEPAVGVDLATPDLTRRDLVYLFLSEPLDSGQVYRLYVEESLADCTGHPAEDTTGIRFGLSASPLPGELLINELLYQPEVGGSEFLEIYHNGRAPFDLNELLIANLAQDPAAVSGLDPEVLIFPGDYVVLTESPASIMEHYSVARPDWLIETDLPSFADDGGNISLLIVDGAGEAVVLDSFDYSPDLHHPLLEENRGVSLERLRFGSSTQSAANWHSAAATAGFATPTAPNSQALPEADASQFSLPYTTFSPDGDGYRDILLIDYELAEAGFAANIRIFDSGGRLVKYLADNVLLGTSGSFLWAGDSEKGDPLSRGIYVCWIEYFHPDGRRQVERISCVLAGNYD